MINWIKQQFCKHTWEDISGEIRIWDGRSTCKMPVGYERTYVCKKCLKKKKIKY